MENCSSFVNLVFFYKTSCELKVILLFSFNPPFLWASIELLGEGKSFTLPGVNGLLVNVSLLL